MARLVFSPKIFAVFASLLIVIGLSLLVIFPPAAFQQILKRLDYLLYDVRLNALLHHQANKPINPIVIVDIDEKSLKQEGRWPWPRNKVAQLLKQIYDQGATVIAFDILFSEPEANVADELITRLQVAHLATPVIISPIQQVAPYFDNDTIFANILAAGVGRNVLGIFFTPDNYAPAGVLPTPAINLVATGNADLSLPAMQSYIGNLPKLQQAAQYAGSLTIIPDEDGTIRRYSLLMRYGNYLYPSLALEAVRLYLLVNNISIQTIQIGDHKVFDTVDLGQEKIKTDEQGRVYIPFIGPAKTFPYYSATDVLNGKLPPHQLENALVFIGTSAVGLGDVRSTPVENVYPGVEVHATVADALFQNHFPYIPAWAPGAEIVLLLIIGSILSIAFAFVGPLRIIIITIAMLTLLFSGSLWLWRSNGMVVPIAMPTLQVLILATFNMGYGFFIESRRRTELKRVFEQYVPPARVTEIISHPEEVTGFEGERKYMSVLFMDIRNFTGISEKLSINSLKKLLNFFLTEMTSVIFKHGGTIDKYVGDMIMAFWGAPLSDEQHAKHAISAGLDMKTTTMALQNKLKEMDLPPVRVGIGINTDMMNVGDMGSNFRRAYTVLGDAVNLASRLESLTKQYGVWIIVGENARKDQNEFIFRQLDRVRVKGKEHAVAIFEPLGYRDQIKPEVLTELAEYNNALTAYFLQDWTTSEKIFTRLNIQHPDTVLYQLYLERIKTFKENPPEKNWDGSWEYHEK